MTTHYCLLSEVRSAVNWGTAGDAAQIRRWIGEESLHLERLCRRRFDHRVETRYYTPLALPDGDLLNRLELLLDDDLLSVSAIVNGDGTTLNASDYLLLPLVATVKNRVRLKPLRGMSWTADWSNDWEGSIQISGIWGYGGMWVTVSGESVRDNPLAASATTMTVVSAASFEAEMVLRIDAEWVRVVAVSSTTPVLTIERGYNRSTAANHTQGTAIARFVPDALAQALVKRLVAWRNEQSKSPLFGTVTLADASLPVQVANIPADVRQDIERFLQRKTGGLVST